MTGGTPVPGLSELEMELVAAVGEGKHVLQVGGSRALAEALEACGCRRTEASEGDDPELPGGRFDVVLVCPGLEELADPGRLLAAAGSLLAEAGSVVASVRNAAHGSERLALLAGEVGDDPRRLRRLTRDSATRLLVDAGLQPLGWRRIEADPLHGLDPLPRVPVRLVEALRRDPEATAIRYVIAAAASGEPPPSPAGQRPTPVLDALDEMEEARQKLEILGSRGFFLARRAQRVVLRVLPRGSSRRAVVLGALRLARRGGSRGVARRFSGVRTPWSESRGGSRGVARRFSGVRTPWSESREAPGLKERLEAFLSDPDRRLRLPVATDPTVSVLVLSYDHAEHTLACLEAIAASTGVAFETIVVDNASAEEATHRLLDRVEGARIVRNPENRGFIGGNNQAAELATGRYLLFLNNDASLSEGALRALVEAAEAADDIGAVGAKLIWPDGRLQEAGSIVWRDGTAQGYGRGDDPDAPEYRFVREVDYCSAACLLVRRDLFEEIGGFDRRYEPAYYEDSDLCMALWSRGQRVLYQPRAVVVHNEYTSSDSERAKALMRTNHQRFTEKWASELATRPDRNEVPVVRARDRRSTPSVLVIDDRVPSPAYGAGSPRMSTLVVFLADAGLRVTFVPMFFSELPQPQTRELEGRGIEVMDRPRIEGDVADIRSILEARRDAYDTVIVSRPHNAAAVLPLLRELLPSAQIVYDAESLFFKRRQAQAKLTPRGIKASDLARAREAEIRLLDAADKVIAVADGEAEAMRAQANHDAVFVWGHASEARPTPRPFALRSDMLFVGTFGAGWTSPNEHGVRRFVTEVMPRIGLERSRLRVVGRGAGEAVADVSAPEVRVDGFVEDLDDVYDACRIFVDPVDIAAGIPWKLTEAMSRGIPAVTTVVSARSLGLVDGEQALVADTDAAFAKAVVRLYSDEALWTHIRDGALRWVEEVCSPERLRAELVRILEAPVVRGAKPSLRRGDAHAFTLGRNRLPRRIRRRL